MFDFEKLDLYQELKKLNLMVNQTLTELNNFDPMMKERWRESSMESVLMLVQGTAGMNPEDKKMFYQSSRGLVFECTSILDMAHLQGHINKELYETFYAGYEKVSKMLLGMYRSQKPFTQPE